MTILDKATKDFITMMRAGNLDGIIIYDLIESYKAEREGENDWATKDALRKVLRHYTNDSQYEEFKQEVGIE